MNSNTDDELSPVIGVYPPTYTCQEACTKLFAATYPAITAWVGSISNVSVTNTCNGDTFGRDCNQGPFADTFSNGTTYSFAGAVSTYVDDHGCKEINCA